MKHAFLSLLCAVFIAPGSADATPPALQEEVSIECQNGLAIETVSVADGTITLIPANSDDLSKRFSKHMVVTVLDYDTRKILVSPQGYDFADDYAVCLQRKDFPAGHIIIEIAPTKLKNSHRRSN